MDVASRAQDLPEEMIDEIAIRLPIDTLNWLLHHLGRIQRLRLSDMHLELAKTRPPGYLHEIDFEDQKICRVLSQDFGQIRSFNSPLPIQEDRMIVGCSNGLVCHVNFNFENQEVGFGVTNPVLRESKRVPPPAIPFNLDILDIFGFTCINNTNSFKILRITQRLQEGVLGSEIFGSNENSWETLNLAWPVYSNLNSSIVLEMNPVFPLKLREKPVTLYCRGHFYWLAWDLRYNIFRGVVCFKVSEERFVVVKTFCSENVTEESKPVIALSEEGSVVVVIKNAKGGDRVCFVNEEVEIWTSYAQFNVTPAATVPLDILNHTRSLFFHVESLLQI